MTMKYGEKNCIRQANLCTMSMESVRDTVYQHFIKDSDWSIPIRSATREHMHKQIVCLRAELKRLDIMLGNID